MIDLSQEKLEKQCHKLKKPIKLVSSYLYEEYTIANKVDFEPFQSR